MRRDVLICLLLALITLGLYWPVGHLGFIEYDDPDYILSNPQVRDGLSVENVWWAFASYHASNWHPVTWLSHELDCQLFGLNPGVFHWENAAWHTANTLLLFLLLRKMTRAVWRSALVAALFAWHPAHLQSVAWIAERKDVLSAFFFLLSLLAYVKYAEIGDRRSEIGSPPSVVRRFPFSFQLPASIFFYGLSLSCFALGLMSKPMLVTLPAILLLLDYWPLGRFTVYDLRSTIIRVPVSAFSLSRIPLCRQLLLEKIPFAVLSLGTVLATFWAQGGSDSMVNTRRLPLLERMANVPVFVTWYLEKLFWPVNLTIYYPYRHIPLGEQTGCFLLVALLTVLCLGCLRCNPRPSTLNPQPSRLVGWLWFLIMLLPVIGLVQVGGQSIADRYTYLPSIGLFLAVVWGLGEIPRAGFQNAERGRPRPQPPAYKRWRSTTGSAVASWTWPRPGRARSMGVTLGAAALLLACVLDTRCQMKYWRNSVTLYQHSLDVAPENNAGSYFGLGCAQFHAGDMDAAAGSFKAALQAESDYTFQVNDAGFHLNLGQVLLRQDKPAEAQAQFEAALKTDAEPADSARFHKHLGDALACEGKAVEAEHEYALAEQLAPDNSRLRCQIAASRTLAGLRATLKLRPAPEIYAQMADTEASQGMERDALEHYLAALKLKPEAPEILNNLAWLLATSRDNKVRDGNRAVAYARHACELTQSANIVFLGTLAAAYAEAGKFDDAITTAQTACDRAAKAGEDGLLQKNQELLKVYRAHQTARE